MFPSLSVTAQGIGVWAALLNRPPSGSEPGPGPSPEPPQEEGVVVLDPRQQEHPQAANLRAGGRPVAVGQVLILGGEDPVPDWTPAGAVVVRR